MERRRSPRYPVNLRVYFPGQKLWGYTRDISLDGCFIVVNKTVNEGFLADILLELPIIGVIFLKGYVQHTGSKGEGVGLQFVQVRFAQEQSAYYSLYVDYINLLPEHEKIRAKYLEAVQKGMLKLQSFPAETS